MSGVMSKIHLGSLDNERLKVFEKLKNFKIDGYLAGGTALALQICHRKSFDFDVFVSKDIKPNFFRKCSKVFGGNLRKSIDNLEQLTFLIPDNISVTFVRYYYQLLQKPILTSSISLASIFDIAADKAHTFSGRAAWRDYVDIFFLLKKKFVALEQIKDLAKKKFGNEFNEMLFFEQLTYFDDVEIVKVDFLRDSYSTKEIQDFLKNETGEFLKKFGKK